MIMGISLKEPYSDFPHLKHEDTPEINETVTADPFSGIYPNPITNGVRVKEFYGKESGDLSGIGFGTTQFFSGTDTQNFPAHIVPRNEIRMRRVIVRYELRDVGNENSSRTERIPIYEERPYTAVVYRRERYNNRFADGTLPEGERLLECPNYIHRAHVMFNNFGLGYNFGRVP